MQRRRVGSGAMPSVSRAAASPSPAQRTLRWQPAQATPGRVLEKPCADVAVNPCPAEAPIAARQSGVEGRLMSLAAACADPHRQGVCVCLTIASW
jgi:hypothetical protein